MDSVTETAALCRLADSEIAVSPVDKDLTDTELALRCLDEAECERRIIVGGAGGRLDHLIALLALFDRDRPPDLWLAGDWLVTSVADRLAVRRRVGSTVSFFAAGLAPCAPRSVGLKWPLDGLEWRKGDGGVSNVIVSDPMEVGVDAGRIVMVSDIGFLAEVLA